jgi:hypothetical protein
MDGEALAVGEFVFEAGAEPHAVRSPTRSMTAG